jgi:diguanylate cyclase (GGDEF)-like protein
MFDIENVFVALFGSIRFRAEPEQSRRSFFASLTFFAWVYMFVAGYINHFQANTDFGSITDPILDVPFLLLMCLANRGGTNEPHRLIEGRAAYFVRAGSPLMLTSTLLAVATSLFNTRPTFAIAGFFAASLGTGLRNVLVQSRSFAESDKLGELARIDGLTGLANRRQFDQTLEDEWKRARRGGDPLALLMIDVDHFKALNDAHGHQAGDDALRLVAKALASCATRGADLVARYGGEEFAVIVPGTHHEGAAALANAMRVAVAQLGIVSPTANGGLTVSIGVGYVHSVSNQDPETLVTAADNALYAAKRAGRDMVMSTELASGFLQSNPLAAPR